MRICCLSLRQWLCGEVVLEGRDEWTVEDTGGGQMDRCVG